MLRLRADTERTFAIVLENDDAVLRWMRPSPKQFNIWYGAANTKRYEPDFVVETADGIYMVETNAERNVEDKDVREKAKAAIEVLGFDIFAQILSYFKSMPKVENKTPRDDSSSHNCCLLILTCGNARQ